MNLTLFFQLWHNSCYICDVTVNRMFRIYLIAVFMFSCVFYSNAQADIHFKVTGHDFGKVKVGKDTLWYNFSFTNAGNEPLEIRDVKTSCDCTLAQWPKTPIMPGKTAIVRGGFKIENKTGKIRAGMGNNIWLAYPAGYSGK